MSDYATVSEGNTYTKENKLAIDRYPWDEATPEDQKVALKIATTAIDQLRYAGSKTDETQVNQFPRGGKTVVPQRIKDACIEFAIAILDDVRVDFELDNVFAVSFKYANASSTYDKVRVPEHLAARIPSNTAWVLLKPFLRDDQRVNLSRVN